MRFGILFILISINVIWFSCGLCCAQDDSRQFPYQAMVKTEGALVRSGPAKVHYATQKLMLGSVVEVYRNDPGGWCAIRPPRDSFSMVPETVLKQISDDTGVILDAGVQAWVGTRLGTVDKPLWQIKLDQDEKVDILGRVSWPAADGQSITWYQIAPPAGEFRWIHISDLDISSTTNDLPESIINSPDQDIVTADFEQSDLPESSVAKTGLQAFETPKFDPNAIRETPSKINHGWKKARTPIRIASRLVAAPERLSFPTDKSGSKFQVPIIAKSKPAPVLPISFVNDTDVIRQLKGERIQSSYQERQVEYQELPKRDISTLASNRLPSIAPMPAGTSRIANLDMALTSVMIQPTAQWNLTPLFQQAEQIVQTGNATEAGQARRIIQKIRNCQDIQHKILNPDGLVTNRTSIASSSPIGTGIDKQVQYGTTYDAFGTLSELVQDGGKSKSTFVLQDRNGKITHHVSGVPGLNLHRYAKQRVGIKGLRGFHNKLQLDHVTAERIIVLDRLR